mmetsp:Transcript_20837/g.24055  ORF Transcript_20837/g.24055 Transcript_20837/m.24055 type:complete len:263 (-) Transcript_20837:41-829(-)
MMAVVHEDTTRSYTLDAAFVEDHRPDHRNHDVSHKNPVNLFDRRPRIHPRRDVVGEEMVVVRVVYLLCDRCCCCCCCSIFAAFAVVEGSLPRARREVRQRYLPRVVDGNKRTYVYHRQLYHYYGYGSCFVVVSCHTPLPSSCVLRTVVNEIPEIVEGHEVYHPLTHAVPFLPPRTWLCHPSRRRVPSREMLVEGHWVTDRVGNSVGWRCRLAVVVVAVLFLYYLMVAVAAAVGIVPVVRGCRYRSLSATVSPRKNPWHSSPI